MIRKPIVAGQFYPGTEKELRETIEQLRGIGSPARHPVPAIGAMLPHAGYMYSGAVAAQTVAACDFHRRCIIIGPNHTGEGEAFSVMTSGTWQTPLGAAAIDMQLAQQIVSYSQYLRPDEHAHCFEHSLEVILPFLQYAKKDITFVPVVVSYADIETCRAIATDIVSALNALSITDSVSVIASSDMTHYEPHDAAQEKDRYALEAVCALDAAALLERVKERQITMCGAVAVAIMLEVAKKLGGRTAEVIHYQTSGDTSGDYSSVVGYAGVRIT